MGRKSNVPFCSPLTWFYEQTFRLGLEAVNVIFKFTGLGKTIKIPQVKYLNNILEQDHRFIKRITGRMLGFKAFHSASATLDGIETAHMIRKGQFENNGLTAFRQFAQLAA